MSNNRSDATRYLAFLVILLAVTNAAARKRKNGHGHSEREQQCREARHPIFIVPGRSLRLYWLAAGSYKGLAESPTAAPANRPTSQAVQLQPTGRAKRIWQLLGRVKRVVGFGRK